MSPLPEGMGVRKFRRREQFEAFHLDDRNIYNPDLWPEWLAKLHPGRIRRKDRELSGAPCLRVSEHGRFGVRVREDKDHPDLRAGAGDWIIRHPGGQLEVRDGQTFATFYEEIV